MKKLYTYLALGTLISVSGSVMASGVTTYGFGEIVAMTVDQMRSESNRDLVQTQKNLVNSTLSGVGGAFKPSSLKKNLEKALTQSSETVTGGYEGLQGVLGKDSEYGHIGVKKCGGNISEVADRVNQTLAYPAKESDRNSMTTLEKNKIASNRENALESSASYGLAKSWIAQSEAANVAEAISNTQEELDNAKSQMAVIGTILRLQEETQKNLNTRLSILGDELTSAGLVVLDRDI